MDKINAKEASKDSKTGSLFMIPAIYLQEKIEAASAQYNCDGLSHSDWMETRHGINGGVC